MATKTKKRKMTYKSKKKLTGTRCEYRAWKDWDVGDVLIGKYVGEQTDQYNKSNWLIEVEDAQFVNKPKLAKKLIGKVIGLNSCGKVDNAMEKAELDNLYQFIYNGTVPLPEGHKYNKKGNKEAHDVDVTEVEYEDEDEELEDEEDIDEDEDTEDEEESDDDEDSDEDEEEEEESEDDEEDDEPKKKSAKSKSTSSGKKAKKYDL